MVVVHGADHTGIVHGLTSAVADAGGNVIELATHLVGEHDAPVYVMTLRVMMPAGPAGETAAEQIRLAPPASSGCTAPCVLIPPTSCERGTAPEDPTKGSRRRWRSERFCDCLIPCSHSPRRRWAGSMMSALRLAEDLVDTMQVSPACVGLAAPQIGVALRAFVVDVTGHKKAVSCHGTVVLFDPEVLHAEAPETAREGCMSVPDLTGDVARPTRLTVAGIGVDGERRVLEVDAFEAQSQCCTSSTTSTGWCSWTR